MLSPRLELFKKAINVKSLDQLMNILTPRMQKQLVDELHNNEADQFLNDHIQIINYDH